MDLLDILVDELRIAEERDPAPRRARGRVYGGIRVGLEEDDQLVTVTAAEFKEAEVPKKPREHILVTVALENSLADGELDDSSSVCRLSHGYL